MIIGSRMAAWMADREAQAETLARVERFNAEYKAQPAIQALDRAVSEAVPQGPGAILAAARTFLASDDAVEGCFALLVDAARADPFFRPGLRGVASEVRSGFLLYDKPELSISAAVAPAEAIAAKRLGREGPASIAFPGFHSILRFVRGGGALISFWEAPEIDGAFSAGSSGRCRLVERRQIEDGDTFELDGRRHSFVVDHAVSDIVYLQAATTVQAAPLMVEYDAETLAFAGASSADDVSSRMQLMLSLLRTLDRQDAAPLFRAALCSPHFYMRWHAMRELLALDAEAGLPCLRKLAQADAHPEVREAAAQTLSALLGEDADEMGADSCPA